MGPTGPDFLFDPKAGSPRGQSAARRANLGSTCFWTRGNGCGGEISSRSQEVQRSDGPLAHTHNLTARVT